jgi:hypothetical protein
MSSGIETNNMLGHGRFRVKASILLSAGGVTGCQIGIPWHVYWFFTIWLHLPQIYVSETI